MLLDRCFRAVWRNYSTLFLIVATVTVPLNLAYAVTFRAVLAVNDLHPAIARFPPSRRVLGVGRDQVFTARLAFVAVVLVEILVAPLLARAAQRVLITDSSGAVPTATSAWRHPGRRAVLLRPHPQGLGPLVAAGLFTALVTWLAVIMGLDASEAVGPSARYIAVGLAGGLAPALGGPFVVGTAAYLALHREDT